MTRLVREQLRGLQLDADVRELDPSCLIGGQDFLVEAGMIRQRWRAAQRQAGTPTQNWDDLTDVVGLTVDPAGVAGPHLASVSVGAGGTRFARVVQGAEPVGAQVSQTLAVTTRCQPALWATNTVQLFLFGVDLPGALARYDSGVFTVGLTGTVDGVGGRQLPKMTGIVQTPDQRLFMYPRDGVGTGPTGPNGATTSRSRGWFSEPTDYLTWLTTRSYDFDPNDGEYMVGHAIWGDMLFVFKQTKMFVLRDVGQLANGSPVFQFHRVPLGARIKSGCAITVGPQGVFFAAVEGVYVTDGGVPRKLSQALDPLFIGGEFEFGWGQWAPGLYREALDAGVRGLEYFDEKVFLQSGAGTLVYDIEMGEWSYWAQPSSFSSAALGLRGFQGQNAVAPRLYALTQPWVGGTEIGAFFPDGDAVGCGVGQVVFAPVQFAEPLGVVGDTFFEGRVETGLPTLAWAVDEGSGFGLEEALTAPFGLAGVYQGYKQGRWRKRQRGHLLVPRLKFPADTSWVVRGLAHEVMAGSAFGAA